MRKYIIPALIGILIWFGFWLYYNPLIRNDIKADINGWYDVQWDVYYDIKKNTFELVSNRELQWDNITFLLLYNPDKFTPKLDDINAIKLSSNMYKITIWWPILLYRFDKIITIPYTGDSKSINVSDVSLWHTDQSTPLSITNIP